MSWDGENTGGIAALKVNICFIKITQKRKTILHCPSCRYEGTCPWLGHEGGVEKWTASRNFKKRSRR